MFVEGELEIENRVVLYTRIIVYKLFYFIKISIATLTPLM